MKFWLTRTYEYEVKDLPGAFQDILLSGQGIVSTEEQWNKLVEDGTEKDTWEDRKKDLENEFFEAYPKDMVGVPFPPTSLEHLVKMQAWDLHEGNIEVDDIFDDPEEEWTMYEPGSSSRVVDTDF